MIALVDCRNFYASCERLFRPDLEGKPIVVLSNNDGCVIARSEESKALGIEMGDPYFQRKDFFIKNNVHCFSSNYELYGDLSERVQSILASFTPELEYYSIDECFLNLDGFTDITEYGRRIKNQVYAWTGIPVGVGIGKTKSLAKVAQKLSKKNGGLFVIDTEEKRKTVLQNFPVADLWGIGRSYATFLHASNITTAWEFQTMPDEWVYKNMTVVGLRIAKELRGTPCIDLELVRPKKKGICSSKSFGKPINNLNELREAVSTYAARIGEKLRKEKTCANLITVFIHTNHYNKNQKQYSASKVIKLPVPSSITTELIHYALQGLALIYKDGYKYKKAGIIVDGLVPEEQIQTNIFDTVSRDKLKGVMSIVDRINLKHGRGTMQVASEGISKAWQMKRDILSPCYTTRWSDIIKVEIKK